MLPTPTAQLPCPIGYQRWIDQANDNFLNANAPNPYNIKNLSALQTSNATLYRYMAGNGFFTGSNISRNQLLRSFPSYAKLLMPGGLGGDSRNGYTNYQDIQIDL